MNAEGPKKPPPEVEMNQKLMAELLSDDPVVVANAQAEIEKLQQKNPEKYARVSRKRTSHNEHTNPDSSKSTADTNTAAAHAREKETLERELEYFTNMLKDEKRIGDRDEEKETNEIIAKIKNKLANI